jgi:hypothetical protein
MTQKKPQRLGVTKRLGTIPAPKHLELGWPKSLIATSLERCEPTSGRPLLGDPTAWRAFSTDQMCAHPHVEGDLCAVQRPGAALRIRAPEPTLYQLARIPMRTVYADQIYHSRDRHRARRGDKDPDGTARQRRNGVMMQVLKRTNDLQRSTPSDANCSAAITKASGCWHSKNSEFPAWQFRENTRSREPADWPLFGR